MNNLLVEALKIIRGTDADDTRTRARGPAGSRWEEACSVFRCASGVEALVIDVLCFR